jgi:hypothetical protein
LSRSPQAAEGFIGSELVVEVPGQQLGDVVDRMICNHREHVAQVGFGIDAVEFASPDQAVDRGSALSARIGAGEQWS